jgi:PhnB protein
MLVQPYLSFEGRAEEAIEFYKKALGAKVTMMMRHKESPDTPPPGMLPPDSGEKIMHSALTIGDSVVMATDGMISGKPNFDGISLALQPDSDEEAKRLFENLAEGGQVTMPLNKTFFASSFGMLKDRFGVHWMVVSGSMEST